MFTNPLRNLPEVMHLRGEEVDFGGLSYLILMLVFFFYFAFSVPLTVLFGDDGKELINDLG